MDPLRTRSPAKLIDNAPGQVLLSPSSRYSDDPDSFSPKSPDLQAFHAMNQESESVNNLASGAMSSAADQAPRRVLLVEDDRAVLRYLQVVLQRTGYEVICAADGLEAMKIALSQPVHAVVTDAIMPHFSGQEFCRFLRSYPTLSTLPVILLSAFTHDASAPNREDQPDAYLSKPVNPEELTECLARLIREKRPA